MKIYKCDVCKNMVDLLHDGGRQLTCCDTLMRELVANTQEASEEKHIPVIERSEKELLVRVGEVEHPMDENHYIEWIAIVSGKTVIRRFLSPGDKPEARFAPNSKDIEVFAYCNLHGLWKK